MELLAADGHEVLAAVVAPRRQLLAQCFSSGRIELVDARDGTVVATRTLLPAPSLLVFSPDEEHLLVGLPLSARVMGIDLADLANLPLPAQPTCACFFGANMQAVAVGCSSGHVGLLENFAGRSAHVASLSVFAHVLSMSVANEHLVISTVADLIELAPSKLQIMGRKAHPQLSGVPSIGCAAGCGATGAFVADGIAVTYSELAHRDAVPTTEISKIGSSSECVVALGADNRNAGSAFACCISLTADLTDATNEAAGTTTTVEILNIRAETTSAISGIKIASVVMPSVEADGCIAVGAGFGAFPLLLRTARRVVLLKEDAQQPVVVSRRARFATETNASLHMHDSDVSAIATDLEHSEFHATADFAALMTADARGCNTQTSKRSADSATSTQRRVAVDVSIDSADINAYHDFMDVFVQTRVVGDGNIKDEVRFIALPSRARAQEIIEKLEQLFDRRLVVSFVSGGGKLVELRPSTARLFEAMNDVEKQLYCRALFPSLAKGRAATPNPVGRSSVAGGDVTAQTQSSLRRANTPGATSQVSSGGGGGSSDAASSSPVQASRPLSRADESSMVQRLYADSQVSRLRSRLQLSDKYFPTAQPTQLPLAEQRELLQRLTKPSAKKEKSLLKSKKAIEEEAHRPPPKRLDREEEAAVVHKFYDEALERERTKRKLLDEKLFASPKATKTLASPEDWKDWHQKMSRPIKQNFRLKDQFY